jgi:hypothetical protein
MKRFFSRRSRSSLRVAVGFVLLCEGFLDDIGVLGALFGGDLVHFYVIVLVNVFNQKIEKRTAVGTVYLHIKFHVLPSCA